MNGSPEGGVVQIDFDSICSEAAEVDADVDEDEAVVAV
jgi:hypothetical protein